MEIEGNVIFIFTLSIQKTRNASLFQVITHRGTTPSLPKNAAVAHNGFCEVSPPGDDLPTFTNEGDFYQQSKAFRMNSESKH